MSSTTFNSNIAALRAGRRLDGATTALRQSFARLSTGLRINRASDDAAGLAISDRLAVDARIYAQAYRNTNDAISLVSIVDATLEQQGSILTRLAELAEQSSNGTLSNAQRVSLNKEYQALVKEFGRLAQTTSLNGIRPLATPSSSVNFQIGITGASTSQLSVASTYTGPHSGVINLTGSHINEDGVTDINDYLDYANATVGGLAGFAAAFGLTAQLEVTDSTGRLRTVLLGAGDDDGAGVTFFLGDLDQATGAISQVVVGGATVLADVHLAWEGGSATSGRLQSTTASLTFRNGATATLVLDLSQLRFTGNTIASGPIGDQSNAATTAIDFTGVESATRSQAALTAVRGRLNELNAIRGDYGAIGSRLETSLSLISGSRERVLEAESSIRNTDVAEEASQLIANQIRQQAATLVLAQANQDPGLLLSLLQF